MWHNGLTKRGTIKVVEDAIQPGTLFIKVVNTIVDVTTREFNGVSYANFIQTIYKHEEVPQEILGKAHELWGNEKWDELYDLFNPIEEGAKKINGGWPPYYGFIKIEGKWWGDDILKQSFDRFQKSENLDGSFAAPVGKDEYFKIDIPYTYDSRALLSNIEEGTVYIKFKIKDSKGLEFNYGPAAPWKNKKGNPLSGKAQQIQSNVKFDELNPNSFEIVQKSVFKNGEWKHIIEDFSKQLDEFKFCKE